MIVNNQSPNLSDRKKPGDIKKQSSKSLTMARKRTKIVGNTFLSKIDHEPRRKGHTYWINDFARFPIDIEDCKLAPNVKLSILKTAQSVVSLISYSGDEQLFICCGVIMECESRYDASVGTILTSATLLRSPNGADTIPHDLKIDVYRVNGKCNEGKVVAVDFHYNVAILQFYPDSPVLIPNISLVDNTSEVGANVSRDRYRLIPGNKVLALARYFREPYDIMVGPGEISSERCYLDCMELCKSSCKIKKNGIGGPLVNLDGEIIGVNFYQAAYTPFLPMNIIIKCFEDLKKNGHVLRPSFGVRASDFHTKSLYYLENVHNKLPHVVRGSIVEEVLPDSPAHIAGLRCDDVIINCNGASVRSCLELTELLWGNEGKSVIELVVARPSTGEHLRTFVDVVEYNRQRVNRWPVPERCRSSDHPLYQIRM